LDDNGNPIRDLPSIDTILAATDPIADFGGYIGSTTLSDSTPSTNGSSGGSSDTLSFGA
jgi:hypothetical protein